MKHFFTAIIIFCSLISCKQTKSVSENTDTVSPKIGIIDSAHNSRNSLDWKGRYTGILPCADCAGIQTNIELKDNNFYFINSIYLGKNGPTSMSDKFSWNEDGGNITLPNSIFGDKKQFKVEENGLRMLDSEGNIIEGDLSDEYLLKKGALPIVSKYYKATEIMGEKIESSPEYFQKNEVHLILKNNGTFFAYGGCNSMFGNYTIDKKNFISFSDIGMTERECMHANFDEQLSEALQMTQQFIVENNSKGGGGSAELQLIVGKRAPLAIFKSIEY